MLSLAARAGGFAEGLGIHCRREACSYLSSPRLMIMRGRIHCRGEQVENFEEEDASRKKTKNRTAWLAYVLKSAKGNKSYIGITYDLERRLKQHNGEIRGGAKCTRAGRPWKLACTIGPFQKRPEALSFEQLWKYRTKDLANSVRPTLSRRRDALNRVLDTNASWGSKLTINWHIDPDERRNSDQQEDGS